jgi:precorrin-3B synthase
VGGAVGADELRVLVGAAALGGSPLELTSRGSLQVRGLSARRADDLADALRGARPDALLDARGRDVPCGLLASPRSGRLDDAAGTVADALRGRTDVPGRLLIALDDGTGDVSGQDADVCVVASGTTAALLLAGTDTGLRHPDPAALALAAVEAFLAVRGDSWRMTEVGVAPVLAALTGWHTSLSGADQPVDADPGRPTPEPGPVQPDRIEPGRVEPGPPDPMRLGLGDDGVLEVLPRLGELTPLLGGVLVALMDAGATLRVTPWRTLVLRDLADPEDALDRVAGLVETGPSRWTGLSACIGAPRCAKSHTDVRADLAGAVAARRAGGLVRAHWVGCHRACGTPGGRVAVVEGTPSGAYRTDVRAGRVGA